MNSLFGCAACTDVDCNGGECVAVSERTHVCLCEDDVVTINDACVTKPESVTPCGAETCSSVQVCRDDVMCVCTETLLQGESWSLSFIKA